MDDITVGCADDQPLPPLPAGPTARLGWRFAEWLEACYISGIVYGEPLNVDVADIESIRKALMRAEREVDTREAQVRESVEGLRYWQTLQSRLRALADGNGTDPRRQAGESVRTRLLRYVNDSKIPVDVDQAQQLVPTARRKTVSWTLWDLARKGEIQKVTEGLYASLDFQASRLEGMQ